MLIHRLRFAALTALLLGALGVGISVLGASAGPRKGESPGEPRIQQMARTEPRPADPTRPAPGRMFVVGRVLSPDGKPVPTATVGVSMRRKLLYAQVGSEGMFPTPSGQAASDDSGRFRLDAPRTSSAHHAEFTAIAVAPGFGAGWAELDPGEDQPSADIKLQPEQLIEGRLLDVNDQPVPGASVSVVMLRRPLRSVMLPVGQDLQAFEGPFRWWGHVNDEAGWPGPATTDAEGRFTLRGIGHGVRARLIVLDPRFAPETFDVVTDAPAGAKRLKATLQPARTLNGRVTHADTGKPAARVRVRVGSGPGVGMSYVVTTESEADGRFRASPGGGPRVNVFADAPDGQPYLTAGNTIAWVDKATEKTVDLALVRGVLLHGKVTEEGTGRPVADAMVHFNPYSPPQGQTPGAGRAWTNADGSFAFGVGAHPGHLSVQAPGEDYQLQVISNAQLFEGQGGGLRLYAHAFLPCDPSKAGDTLDVDVALRPGATVRFRLIGPDGQPARDVWVYSRSVLGPTSTNPVRSWLLAFHDVARHGQFEVHGLDAETEVPVHFLQPDRKLGATVRVSGQMAARGPITVRLEPCGQAMARLVGPDGQPVTGQSRGVSVVMVVAPGPPIGSAAVRAGALAAHEAAIARVGPINHGLGPIADAQGRITLPALIPGATYRIIDRGPPIPRGAANPGEGPLVRREFVVGPGQAVELGDVLVRRPGG